MSTTSAILMLLIILQTFDHFLLLSSFFHIYCLSLVFVPLFVFLFSIYSLALIKMILDPHQVEVYELLHTSIYKQQ